MRSLIGMLGLTLAGAQSPDAFPSRLSGLAPSPTTPMVVFLAGFPDDTHSFDAVAPAFEGTHTVLKLALPGYEGAPISNKWGLPFTTLVEKMHDAIEAQAGARRSAPRRARLGCLFGTSIFGKIFN